MTSWLRRSLTRLGLRIAPRPDDLLRDAAYRRLWTSILISSFGGQVTMLALPLTAAVLLQATPTQMGLLTAMEIAPFVLLSLFTGVWLDRVRKLPVYVIGECLLAVAVASVPLAWWLGVLSMGWMYGIGFVLGCVRRLPTAPASTGPTGWPPTPTSSVTSITGAAASWNATAWPCMAAWGPTTRAG